MNAEELETVLTVNEKLARSLGKLEFRGWREPDLSVILTRDQAFLLQRRECGVSSCNRCKSFAVDSATETIEKTIETERKVSRKKVEKISSAIKIEKTVHTCHSCGFVDIFESRIAPMSFSSSSSDSSSSEYSSSSPNSDYSSSYDNNTYSDNSSSSDFGGGSSDGGGAGSDW